MFEWNGRKNALNLFSETAQVFDTKYIKAKIHGQFKLLDFLQYFKNVTFRLLHMRRMITLVHLCKLLVKLTGVIYRAPWIKYQFEILKIFPVIFLKLVGLILY